MEHTKSFVSHCVSPFLGSIGRSKDRKQRPNRPRRLTNGGKVGARRRSQLPFFPSVTLVQRVEKGFLLSCFLIKGLCFRESSRGRFARLYLMIMIVYLHARVTDRIIFKFIIVIWAYFNQSA